MQKRILAVIIVVVLVIAGVGGFFAYNYTHPASTDLPTMHLTALSPLNALATYQTGVIVSDMKALGLPVSLSLVTGTESGTWLTPNSTPQFVDLGWLPDWPDPIAQQLYPMTDYSNGLLLCITENMMWHIFLDDATRAFFFGIPLSTSLL